MSSTGLFRFVPFACSCCKKCSTSCTVPLARPHGLVFFGFFGKAGAVAADVRVDRSDRVPLRYSDDESVSVFVT